MSSSSLQFVTYAIADAMLAGPPETAAMVERMTLVLGEPAEWMNGLARRVAKRFGSRWDSVDSKELSKVVAENAGFVAAWRGESRPRVLRVLPRPPVQRPAPPWLHDAVLPQLPTLGDLAAWLEIEPDELDWFADRWRVPAQDAGTRLHHYSYKVGAGLSKFLSRDCGLCRGKCFMAYSIEFLLTMRCTVFDVGGIRLRSRRHMPGKRL
jgi:RNA-directed DNA polymerase